jgi:hypothetical protein
MHLDLVTLEVAAKSAIEDAEREISSDDSEESLLSDSDSSEKGNQKKNQEIPELCLETLKITNEEPCQKQKPKIIELN